MESFRDRLSRQLTTIVAAMDDLLDASTIIYDPGYGDRLARSGVFVAVPDSKWGPLDDEQRAHQRRLLGLWNPWVEQLQLLFSADTEQSKEEIRAAVAKVNGWIERDGRDYTLPKNIAEAKVVFRTHAAPLERALQRLTSLSSRLVAVPDTNVLIRSPDLARYGNVLGTDAYTVLLVPGVLHELDEMKVNHRNENVREKARKVVNRIKGWRTQGRLAEGVRVQGDVFVRVEAREPDFEQTLSWLDPQVDDDRIIASVLEVQRTAPTDTIVLLSGDSIMLAKADLASIPTTDTPDPDL